MSLVSFVILGLSLVQQGSYVIRGTILAPGETTDRVEVVLEKSQDRPIAKTLSDSNGGFEFRVNEPGRYEVFVHVDGYDDARENVDVGASSMDAALAAAAAENQDVPVVAEAVTGSVTVYMLLHKKGAAADESDPELTAVAELSRKYSKKILQDYQKAVEYIRKGDHVHAAEQYEAILKLAPEFYYGHSTLGSLYLKAERYRDAEREYNAARKLNPRVTPPLLNLGKLYLQEAEASAGKGPSLVGRILDQALDAFEEATKLDPSSATAYFLLGTAYYRSDFNEEAETNLKRAIELDSKMGPARLMLANVYSRQEKWDDALKLLDSYLATNPNAPDRAQILEVRTNLEQNRQTPRK